MGNNPIKVGVSLVGACLFKYASDELIRALGPYIPEIERGMTILERNLGVKLDPLSIIPSFAAEKMANATFQRILTTIGPYASYVRHLLR